MFPADAIARFGRPIHSNRVVPNGTTRLVGEADTRWALTVWTQGAGLQLAVISPLPGPFANIVLQSGIPLHLVYPYQGLVCTMGFNIVNSGAASSCYVVESFIREGTLLDLPLQTVQSNRATRKRSTPTPSAKYFLTQRKR